MVGYFKVDDESHLRSFVMVDDELHQFWKLSAEVWTTMLVVLFCDMLAVLQLLNIRNELLHVLTFIY